MRKKRKTKSFNKKIPKNLKKFEKKKLKNFETKKNLISFEKKVSKIKKKI